MTQRDEKVRFLESKYKNGRKLPLPERMEHSNIIQHESLPIVTELRGNAQLLTPEHGVYDFPEEFWPPTNTPLIPQGMGADELLKDCSRSRKRRIMFPGNISNSAVEEFKLNSAELEHALQRAERLPELHLQHNLQRIRKQLGYPDSIIFEQKYKDRRQSFVKKIKDEFHERDIGDCPDTDCPEQLTREIGRRLKRRFQSSQTSIQIPCTMYGNSSTNSETTASDVNHTDAPSL